MTTTGVTICEHASSYQATVDEIATLANQLPVFLQDKRTVKGGFLAFAHPEYPDAKHTLGPERVRRA